ncbi:hypothetical protein O181_013920 [Austropuccinia psidii MF-1]|uniref:Uncharacterized protein n=1 Tax=Austropuccinia psidii MF-1 TaxID=1389203 RepID=A0A9Q3GPF0_9BASI|nr:hypothetical protein [Austropuccinia psidii MF-1]
MSEGARARLGESEDEEGKDSGETVVADALENAPEQITQFMGQLTHAVAPRENFKAPSFKTLSLKAPDSFDGNQAHKSRGLIQSC